MIFNPSSLYDRSLRFLHCIPILLNSFHVAYVGFENEWNGCDSLLRAVGHTGIFIVLFCIPFVVLNHHLGRAAVSLMCLLQSLRCQQWWWESTLIANGFVTMTYSSQRYEPELFLLSVAFSRLPFDLKSLPVIEFYALCGHITLVVVALQYEIFSKVISSLIALSLCFREKELVGGALALVCLFTQKRAELTQATSIKLVSRTLWACKLGRVKTMTTVAYGVVLFLQEIFLTGCDQLNKTNIELHAIHVGGICAICIFVLPQMTDGVLFAGKLTVGLAAFSDASFSVLKFQSQAAQWSEPLRICLLAKIFFASALAPSMFTLENSPGVQEDTTTFSTRPSFFSTRIRQCLVMTSIAAWGYDALYVSEYEMNTLENCFASLVHDCLIIGGLSVISIHLRDRLFMHLAQTLLAAKMLGILAELWIRQSRYDDAKHIFMKLGGSFITFFSVMQR